MSLLLAAIYVSVACVGNYICSLLIDRLGRVNLLGKIELLSKGTLKGTISPEIVIGLSGCMVSLICEAALAARFAGGQNEAGLRAGIFFMFLFITLWVAIYKRPSAQS